MNLISDKRKKLDEDDVKLIFALIDEGIEARKKASDLTKAKIAAKFGISTGHLYDIINGKYWGHVQ